MDKDIIRLAALAVDDDNLLTATVKLGYNGREYEYVESFEVERRVRNINIKDDQAEGLSPIDIAEIVSDIQSETDAEIDAFAVSCFGTIDIESGRIRHVPNTGAVEKTDLFINFPSIIRRATGNYVLPVFVDNDASSAALGEKVWGSGDDVSSFAYVWVGRGINAGLILNDDIWRGRLHPEAGHMLARAHRDDVFRGQEHSYCASHLHCVLGRAAFRSIPDRRDAGMHDETITRVIAYYIAQLCMNVVLLAAPEAISLGGYTFRAGKLPRLTEFIRQEFGSLLGEYPTYAASSAPANFIRDATWGDEASLLGAIENARRNLSRQRRHSQKD